MRLVVMVCPPTTYFSTSFLANFLLSGLSHLQKISHVDQSQMVTHWTEYATSVSQHEFAYGYISYFAMENMNR